MSKLQSKFIALPSAAMALLLFFAVAPSSAQTAATVDPPFYGPFNGSFIADGDGLDKKLADHDSVLRAESPWSLYCWVRLGEAPQSPTPVAGVGDPNEEYPRYLGLDAGKVTLWLGKNNGFGAAATLAPAGGDPFGGTVGGREVYFF